ncbi:MAG: heavy-metal-associated domain-containing protein [bacterium]|nr:heavy-metal-associated domain-containing protein [bacterium]
MTTETIKIANLKCNGCASTIKKELQAIECVNTIEVDLENDSIQLSYTTDRNLIINRLLDLGYPEATEKNGLLLQLKSYGSCMIGKLNNLQSK